MARLKGWAMGRVGAEGGRGNRCPACAAGARASGPSSHFTTDLFGFDLATARHADGAVFRDDSSVEAPPRLGLIHKWASHRRGPVQLQRRVIST